eukprot:TRINITY_DN6284_c0_g2_i1.p1 TRINITY_DN6284_c0_g2~~TRINITY_DN6284_c0_g2_i1.p1  ORF type:complete len:312 (+),score=54.23 TRINITY_DN6284_c0_g2_i1:358-1293(+)
MHFYCNKEDKQEVTNTIFIIGCYCILCKDFTVKKLKKKFSKFVEYIIPFRDATPSENLFELKLKDCWKSLVKAKMNNIINMATFDFELYTHYEQVENGDMNWIIQSKILAMMSPTDNPINTEEDCTHKPEFYINFFEDHSIKTIIRLNKVEYDETYFIEKGIEHHEMYFNDGTVPSLSMVEKFISIVEGTLENSTAIAVHCKQGIGRTGTLIACYLIKNYQFSAPESIAFVRIMRPGSIVGMQQLFLENIEPKLLKWGSKDNKSKKKNSKKSLKRKRDEESSENAHEVSELSPAKRRKVDKLSLVKIKKKL